MINGRPDWLLLDRFLAGECSPAEIEQLQRWYDRHPDVATELDAFRETLRRHAGSEAAPEPWNVDRAWSRLDEITRDAGAQYRLPPPLRRADGAVSADDVSPGTVPRGRFDVGRAFRPAQSPWLRAAAVLLLVGGGVGGGLTFQAWHESGHVSAAGRVIVTQRAERADLRLADGTRVVLAPESRLEVPDDFGLEHRELSLVGEGYFEVVHDSAKPFLVYAGHGVVHDLGTRFSVRAYPADSVVNVAVAEGRVVVGLAGAPLPLQGPILIPGDAARLDSVGATIVTRGIEIDRYQGWVEGRLHFAAMPLRDVLSELARWYSADFEIADAEIGNRRLTIAIRDEPLEQILGTIAQVTHSRYDRAGHLVRFFALPISPLAPRAPE